MKISHLFFIACSSMALLFLSGCQTNGYFEAYTPQRDHIYVLRDNVKNPISVQDFTAGDDYVDKAIGLRALTGHSPYDESFTKYIQKSLEKEFALAKKLSKNSEIEIGGILKQNVVTTAGGALIRVEFFVEKDNKKIYSREIKTHERWHTAFIGTVAIRNALENYKFAVADVLEQLVNDKNFIEAINK